MKSNISALLNLFEMIAYRDKERRAAEDSLYDRLFSK